MPLSKNDDALSGLVRRVTPDLVHAFEFALTTEDAPAPGGCFEIDSSSTGTIVFRAANTRELAAAYGWYLKHMLHLHFSWTAERVDVPSRLPLPAEKTVKLSPWKYRYAYNYCALSYTMPFHQWPDWEHEIDRLAVNGFTHALVTAGLEKVWQQTLAEKGYPPDRTAAFIAHPVYAAWWHMGNLEGMGGPLSQGMIEREAELGAKIVQRMRELGITPVLQGFMGLVPHDLGSFFPGLRLFPQGEWLDEFQRPALLDPGSEGFRDWASVWYRQLHELYGGTTTAYAGDLFHEGGDCDGLDLPAIAMCIEQAMQRASPGSRWLLQSWRENPLPGLLKGLHPRHSLVLELWKDMSVAQMHHDALRTYEGRPWLWCEVTNFGGNHDLYGGLSFLSMLPSWLLDQPGRDHVCGLGLLSEGLDTNSVQYDLFTDLFFSRSNINLQQWLDGYVIRRYGRADQQVRKALDLLASSVYDAQRKQEGSTESILCARPSLEASRVTTWASDQIYYHPCQVIQAAAHLLKASPEVQMTATYRYDLVDVVRQVMADMGRPLLAEIRKAFRAEDRSSYRENACLFLQLFDDTDRLLASDRHWLLGSWLERARRKGKTGPEKALMEKAARRMVTTWSGRRDLLNEYSHRQWAGLMKDYYKPRWELFFDLQEAKMNGTACSAAEEQFAQTLCAWEVAFENKTDGYEAEAKGDPLEISRELFARYAPAARVLWDKHPELVSIR